MDTQGRLQEDNDDPSDPNQLGVPGSTFLQAQSMTTYDATLDDDSRYLYNSHDDLWYDWTTGEFSRYDPDNQVYIAVTGKEEEEEEDDKQKDDTLSIHEEEYDPFDDDDDNDKPVKADAPLLRLVVLESTLLTVGHVVEVDSSGLTVGRDRSWDRHRLRLAELAVSKFHCQIYYDGGSYHITDQGSKNGTFVNDERLCDPKTSSIPRVIRDLDRIQIGSSLFQAHQHKHGWQCDYCMTGPENTVDISQGSREKNINSNQSDNNTTTTTTAIDFKSKEQREKEWMDELRRRKRMYAPKANPAKNVNDAAERRRKLYASTTVPSYLRKTSASPQPSEQHQWGDDEERRAAATIERATVHTPVKGIGDSMLRKMGWKQGQTLGRTGTEGITVPITPKTQTHRAGLGKNSTTETLSYESPKSKIPRITRERYNALN
ncbi:hypothetical protein RO3G_10105 [Lichtheimia corymbifera JMRC:FSU:9682]|uniref:Angiogenic factor with g patch and fha domains 1 n=1 Tax=Lichtheimia corymbifera JMRC:FSU:9682 TaxID=1263082 RepID=A0A068SC40_9FUNG|nr:hypothetical protein RO3G_10105 [Lichtheimia corymbifera JMRC:FSU:9682]